MKVQAAINKAAWVHNTNISSKGFTPLQIATGQGSKIPTFGIQKLKEEVEEMSTKEQVGKVLRIQKLYMEVENDRLVEKCIKQRGISMKNWHREMKF